MSGTKIILLLIFIVGIIVVYNYYKKSKVSSNSINTVTSPVNTVSKTVNSNTGNVIQAPVSSSAVVAPVSNANANTWKIGDKLYAGNSGVNTYSAPSPSETGIVKFYNKDAYIGTYLSNDNGYAKIIVQSQTNVLLQAFGYNEIAVVYSPVNQIYSK